MSQIAELVRFQPGFLTRYRLEIFTRLGSGEIQSAAFTLAGFA